MIFNYIFFSITTIFYLAGIYLLNIIYKLLSKNCKTETQSKILKNSQVIIITTVVFIILKNAFNSEILIYEIPENKDQVISLLNYLQLVFILVIGIKSISLTNKILKDLENNRERINNEINNK